MVLSTNENKTHIDDDGVDAVVFTVMSAGEDVTAQATITQNGAPFTGTQFKSETTGSFKFKATYDGKTSNEATIVVDQSDLVLTSTGTQIMANGTDKIFFIAMYGAKDVTSIAEFYDARVLYPGGSSFSAPYITNPKSYDLNVTARIEARYKNKWSNRIEVVALDYPQLEITSDKMYVRQGETVTFTVTRGGENITSECGFRVEGGADLADNTFSNATDGTYKVYAYLKAFGSSDAQYRESGKAIVKVMPAVTGEATFNAGKTVHKTIGYVTHTGTWCTPCFQNKKFIANLGTEKNDHIQWVNIFDNGHGDPRLVDATTLAKVTSDLNRWQITGYPTLMIDFADTKYGALNPTTAGQTYDAFIGNAPKTAIKVESTLTGNTINATVTVGAQEAGTYFIGAMLVEDNVIGWLSDIDSGLSGVQPTILNSIHTDVYRNVVSQNALGDPLGTMTVGQELTKSFTVTVPAKARPKHTSLVVYTTFERSGKKYMANIVKAPADGITTGYRYVEPE